MTKDAFFKLIGYSPHLKQKLYHLSDARFKVSVCGRRFGKSTMAARDIEPLLFQKNKTIWIVGPTYDLADREFSMIWDDLIIGQKLGQDKRVKKSYNKRSGDMMIQFPWGTTLEAKSAEHPERLVGDALDYVIMSEAAKHKRDTWLKYIRPALSDKRGGASFPTTPEGFNWLHGLYQDGQDPNLGEWASWRFPSWDNTAMYPGGLENEEIQSMKREMLPEEFDQEIAALFTSFVGKIFPEWDEDTHVTRVEYDPSLPNYVAFDWGYTNPLAAVEFQVDSWDRIRVWRVHYRAFTRLEDHLALMKARKQPEGYKIDLAFGDAADPEAAATVSTYLAPCLTDPNAKTNWRQGIDLLRSFMRIRPDGRPGFVVDHSCKPLIHEFNNYKAKKPASGTNVPEMGQKIEDHTIDAVRYALMHLFVLGAQHHLTDIYGAGDLDMGGRGFTVADSGLMVPSSGSFFTLDGVA